MAVVREANGKVRITAYKWGSCYLLIRQRHVIGEAALAGDICAVGHEPESEVIIVAVKQESPIVKVGAAQRPGVDDVSCSTPNLDLQGVEYVAPGCIDIGDTREVLHNRDLALAVN